jgi:hypothetical protein
MGSKKKVQESGYLNMRSKNIRFLKDIALPHNYKIIYYVLY